MAFLNNFEIGELIDIEFTRPTCVYTNQDNYYSVYDCHVTAYFDECGSAISVDEKIRITGYFENLQKESVYKAHGKVSEYKGYLQLNILGLEEQMPSDLEGIYNFLSSGIIKHVGKATAHKIVYGYKDGKKGAKSSHPGFGLDALNVIEKNHMALAQISGISESKAKLIYESYMANRAYANLVMFLSKFNISPSKILRVYKIHGLNTLDVIQNKPYSLSDSVRGFGFATCDKIALSMEKFTIHNKERLKYGLIYCIEKALTEQGHCYLEKEELFERAISELSLSLPLNECASYLKNSKPGETIYIKIYEKIYKKDYDLLKRDYDRVKAAREKRNDKEKIYIDKVTKLELVYPLEELISEKKFVLIRENGKELVYERYVYEVEEACSRMIDEYIKTPAEKLVDFNIDDLIEAYEETVNITLEAKQKDSIKMMLNHNFGLLAGSAGTGKTFTLNALIDILKFAYKESGKSLEVALCAPTGKAAKRATESTGIEAKTIHRLLGFKGETFEYDENNKLEASMVIVDESSMMDIFLMHSLLKALDSKKTKLLFVGDHKQLPPVGPGCPFVDLLNNVFVPKTILDVIKRQAEGSSIVKNANRIIEQEMIESDNINKDFYIIPAEETETVINKTIKSVERLLELGYSLADIGVICPQNKGSIGTKILNAKLQEVFNPSAVNKAELKYGDTVFRKGDKVIHMSNNYNLRHYKLVNEKDLLPDEGQAIYNGETGVVFDIIEQPTEDGEDKKKLLAVKYDDFYALYEHNDLEDLELAYALTVHKMQGSQLPATIFICHYSNYNMLNNALGYTAITRSQKFAAVIGQIKAIKHMIRNVVTFKRNTQLNKYIFDNARYGLKVINQT